VFNCTGLGAAALFGDDELVPAKGQLVFLPPDPAVDYLTIGGGSDSLYMFSRSDVLLLGGTFGLGDWSLHADPQQTERIVREHQRVFSSFG
jgi:D-amino-acid oxidase